MAMPASRPATVIHCLGRGVISDRRRRHSTMMSCRRASAVTVSVPSVSAWTRWATDVGDRASRQGVDRKIPRVEYPTAGASACAVGHRPGIHAGVGSVDPWE